MAAGKENIFRDIFRAGFLATARRAAEETPARNNFRRDSRHGYCFIFLRWFARKADKKEKIRTRAERIMEETASASVAVAAASLEHAAFSVTRIKRIW